MAVVLKKCHAFQRQFDAILSWRRDGGKEKGIAPRVVIVEDNSFDEQLTLAGLAATGLECEIFIARDGEEALRILREVQPDLILLDVKVPKLSGLSLLDWIRSESRLRSTPAVILSSWDDEDSMTFAYSRGASGYVVKPLDHEVYVARVKAACLGLLSASESMTVRSLT